MQKPIKIKFAILLILGIFVMTAGLRCKFITPSQKALLEPIELTWWGVFDDPENFTEIINEYRALHPNISVNYRKLRIEEFEKELLDALAEDRGPDIISLHNTWLTKYLPKLESLPAKTKLAYEVTKKSLGIKEETLIEVREAPSLTPAQLKDNFIDVVYNDVVRDNKIYGLPLSVDTLVLFYNRDLFNNAGIPLPPQSWISLQENVKRLTFADSSGNLAQAGIALGTAENVERSFDILSLLMMQNGAQMTTADRVTFNLLPPGFPDRTYNPGPEAVRFYTDFANSGKEVYAWNENFPNSLEAFAQGRVAMIFGYNYHLPYLEIKRQGKLNYGVTKIPQIEGRNEVNYASYWVQTVSQKSKHINEAWDFIQFLTKKNQAKKYLDKTLKPTALRSLIEEQISNDKLKIFVEQLLTAKSWYTCANPQATETAFKEMIELARKGADLQQTVTNAVLKVQQTMR